MCPVCGRVWRSRSPRHGRQGLAVTVSTARSAGSGGHGLHGTVGRVWRSRSPRHGRQGLAVTALHGTVGRVWRSRLSTARSAGSGGHGSGGHGSPPHGRQGLAVTVHGTVGRVWRSRSPRHGRQGLAVTALHSTVGRVWRSRLCTARSAGSGGHGSPQHGRQGLAVTALHSTVGRVWRSRSPRHGRVRLQPPPTSSVVFSSHRLSHFLRGVDLFTLILAAFNHLLPLHGRQGLAVTVSTARTCAPSTTSYLFCCLLFTPSFSFFAWCGFIYINLSCFYYYVLRFFPIVYSIIVVIVFHFDTTVLSIISLIFSPIHFN